MEKGTRNEINYRNSNSASGEFSPHIRKKTADRIVRYCKIKNLNKTRFVEDCINKVLDDLEREALEALPKEQLIKMIMEG